MSHSQKNPNLSNKLIDVLVNDIFRKNNINIDEAKKNLSDEQKMMIKELVDDLSQQVDHFLHSDNSKKTE